MNRAAIIELARFVALHAENKPGYAVPGFMPHDWVVFAMEAAYDAGKGESNYWTDKFAEVSMTGMGDG